jgi:hypothetical protein
MRAVILLCLAGFSLATSGCSLLKLTVLTGPGCCETSDLDQVVPAGVPEQQVVVHTSIVVEAQRPVQVVQPAPIVIAPPPVVVVVPPGFPMRRLRPPPPPVQVGVAGDGPVVVDPGPRRIDVRVQCSMQRRNSLEQVTMHHVEYGTVERIWLGFYAFGATVMGTTASVFAWQDSKATVGNRVEAGVLGAAFLADGLVTAGLAIFHPTEQNTLVSERPGMWAVTAQDCPADLALVADGVRLPVDVTGHLAPSDAFRLAQAVEARGLVDVSVGADVRPLAFVPTATTLAVTSDAEAVVPIDAATTSMPTQPGATQP